MPESIGIFDSGIGGLSVLKAILEKDPQLGCIYIADSAFTPYGEKTEKEIIDRCFSITEYLIEQQVDLIVVACNTATAIAINQMREKYTIPIVAMEPGLKPAIKNSDSGKIGILATTRTLQSHRYARLLERFTSEENYFTEQACPGLVELIEDMQTESQKMKLLLHKYIRPMLNQQIDTFVLGCTHYPFIKEQIQQFIGKQKQLVDTSEAIARQVFKKLQDIESDNVLKDQLFLTTGDIEKYRKQLAFYDIAAKNIEAVKI